MKNQTFSSGNNDYFKINNSIVNNTISCYQRPIINYKKKKEKEKSFNLKIYNKENINLNNNNEKGNFFRIYKKNNNNKISLSRNISFLCGVINSMNNTSTNKKINNNIKKLFHIKKEENKKESIKQIIIIQKWWKKMYCKTIKKINLIQFEWRKYMKNKTLNNYYYFSFKKLISSKNDNNNNISANFNSNLKKSFKKEESDAIYDKLRKKFIFYIAQKLSKFFILLLNKLNLFNLIQMLSQRIMKNINQYVFYLIYNNNKINDNKINNNNKIFFFDSIRSQIKVNLDIDENNINEISFLLKTNIPKLFLDDFNKKYIPYINSIQEKNLINTQLFLYNNEKLINYIIYFLEKRKGEKLNDKIKANYKKYIKNDLNLHKLKNRNIFGITKYINNLCHNFALNPKIQLITDKESFHSENIEEDNLSENDFEKERINDSDNCQINVKNFTTKFFQTRHNN